MISTTVVTDASGAKAEEIRYYPYGLTLSDTGTVSLSHKYTSQELDSETGLYYYNARYYDPALSKFISPDPAKPQYADPQQLNKYSYALNNPLNYTDPTGKAAFWQHFKVQYEVSMEKGYSFLESISMGMKNMWVDFTDSDPATHATARWNQELREFESEYEATIAACNKIDYNIIQRDLVNLVKAAHTGIDWVSILHGGKPEPIGLGANVDHFLKEVLSSTTNLMYNVTGQVMEGKGCDSWLRDFQAEMSIFRRFDTNSINPIWDLSRSPDFELLNRTFDPASFNVPSF